MFVERINLVSIVIAALIVFARSAPIEIDGEEQPPFEVYTPIPIISQSDESSPDGSFSYSFETGNHIKQQASGYHKTVLVPRLREDGSKSGDFDTTDVSVQSGSYSYVAPDGTIISVHYVADENGFQAFGDHLPTPPPIPETILNSLKLTSGQLEDQPAELAAQDNTTVSPEFAENDDLPTLQQ